MTTNFPKLVTNSHVLKTLPPTPTRSRLWRDSRAKVLILIYRGDGGGYLADAFQPQSATQPVIYSDVTPFKNK